VWMRNREVWIHAVDLGNGARFCDFPPVVLESLLTDIVTTWHRKAVGADVVLAIDGRDPIAVGQQSCSGVTVSGPLPAVVRWAAGRGSIGIRAIDQLATAPRWL
jgi:maleylpyruvate isomerase